MLGRSAVGAVCALLLGAFVLASPVGATDYTVASGQTVGPQALVNGYDTETIEQGGAIISSTYGVLAIGGHNTITNYGTIDANSEGIDSNASYGTVTNGATGLITGSGTGWKGIYSAGDHADLENFGTIEGSGDSAFGIVASGYQSKVINRGSISTSGDYAQGIQVNNGSSTTVDNEGGISATGVGARGILSVNSDNATIVNRGEIATSGDSSQGIFIVSGSGIVVTNSGRIIANGTGARAIDFEGSDTTLNLLAGTVLQGDIYILNADGDTLNIGTGLNTALTFYDASDLPATIDTNGQPYVIDGSLLAVVDPTGLAAANSFGFDLARSITDAVEARMGSPNGDGLTAGALPGSDAAVHRDYWTAGLGFYSDHAARGSLDGYGYGAAGMMAGADRALSASTTAGLFGGFSAGAIETDAGSTNINAVGAFAGGYWSRDDGKAFAHVSLVGGGLDNTSDRTVANNLVSGGLETASAEYGSFYLSPALTLGLHRTMGDATLSPSIGVRYAGLYRGAYTESGSTADVTADGSTAQALDVRGEIRTDFATKVSDAGVRRYNVRAGVDGIFTWGGAVDGTLLGTDLLLLASSQQSVARGYLGAGTTFTGTDGSVFNADVLASYDTADTFGLSAQAGMNRAF